MYIGNFQIWAQKPYANLDSKVQKNISVPSLFMYIIYSNIYIYIDVWINRQIYLDIFRYVL